MSKLRGVTLAGLAKKYPKNGGVRKAIVQEYIHSICMIHIEQLVYDQLFSKAPCHGKNVNFCRVHEQIKVLKENFAKENRLYTGFNMQ
jgi:hypothetical protein